VATIATPRSGAARRDPIRPLGRAADAFWRLFTSVDFAVLQIIYLAILATIGMTLRQLPDSAFRSVTDYQDAMATIHGLYDPLFGASVVDALERLQLFQVFRSTWFSLGLIVLLLSIVICTIDRTPRLWRQVRELRVIQPTPFYDPTLPDRAAMTAVALDGLRSSLRGRGFRVREAAATDATYVYGERNRYTKLATLLTHAGLILFLIGAAVTSVLGEESGLVVAEGDSLTVQPIGTPDLLLVKNYGFEAPGLATTGAASDFTTDIGVYQNGREIARKTVRVNDPLSVAGYTFHENGFGPAPDLVLRDRTDGRLLWSGPVPLTDQAAGFPFGTTAVPGREAGLQLLLQRSSSGGAVLLVVPYRVIGTETDGSPKTEELGALALEPGETGATPAIDFTVGFRDTASYTLLIAKHDPGQGVIWLAFALLITGLAITFYFPRRRVWARLDDDGQLGVVFLADRYVDVEREFGRLLDDLVAARPRGGATPSPDPAPG
jgi:cytochrome c biogenesis protein